MAKDSHKSAGAGGTEKTGGTLPSLFADENEFDRRVLWRLAWWGAGAVGAVGLAVFTNQTAQGWRQARISAADLSRQAQLIQSLARETQGEARQLGAAIETLNTDRDRLYARVTVLEQGLESVTGALAKQGSSAANPNPPTKPPALPQIVAVDSQPLPASSGSLPAFAGVAPFGTSLNGIPGTGASQPAPLPSPPSWTTTAPAAAAADKIKSEAGKVLSASTSGATVAAASPSPSSASSSEPATGKPAEADRVAKAEPAESASAKATEIAETSATPVPKTEFAVDLGSANSLNGLRALWRGLARANAEVAALRPIIILKEGQTGLGMQLRLGAGPLNDAAAAAKICAALAESQRPCETTIYDGQRLAVRDEPEASDAAKPASPAAAQKPTGMQRRRSFQPQAPQQRHGKREEPPAAALPAPPAAEPPKPEQPSALSSFFRRS